MHLALFRVTKLGSEWATAKQTHSTLPWNQEGGEFPATVTKTHKPEIHETQKSKKTVPQ